jgi:hypothetical protein
MEFKPRQEGASGCPNESIEKKRPLTLGRKYLKFQTLDKESVGQPVIFRARLHNMRPQGELPRPHRIP